MTKGERIAAAARARVGTRFRPQGRGEDGLDCIGLVAAALGCTAVPADYALRGGDPERVAAALAAAGLVCVDPATPRTGDVLLLRTGPGQLHLSIVSATGFVHADARLRRVVEVPGAPPWPVLAAWRTGEG